MDVRELQARADLEEVMRTVFSGLMSHVWTAMPVVVYEDSEDGHTAKFQVTVKRAVQNLSTGQITYEDHPVSVDVPVHHPQGGQVASTYPTKKGDEGVGVFANRNIDGWHQNGSTQPPVDNRSHSVGDMMHVRGHRSDPNKLQQVDPDSVQHRSVDKRHVHEVHPQAGVTSRAVDPSTPVASPDFDPFTQATRFFDHSTHPTQGVSGRAVDGGTTHSHGVDHDQGAWMSAASGQQLVRAHPSLGALLSAGGGAHLIHADPSAGVTVSSQTAVSVQSQGPLSLSAPAGLLSLAGLAGGSIAGAALAAGAASSNVGNLGGDLGGQLPDPTVVALGHVDVRGLTTAASDSAAASAGVQLGGLYLNKSVSSGLTVLCARMS